jgi:aldehyde dehydrogenase (NAD+)
MNFKTDISYRKDSLKKLLNNIIKYENDIIDALYKDFKKPAFEAVLTETNYVRSDLKETIKNINKWSKPKRVFPSILNFPSSDYIYSEPYGNTLIISPWNYPYQLAMCPLIAAVAAGNKITLKPSELTPNTSSIISKIVRETFDVKHVVVITGDATVSQELLKQRWDYIFFTGSVPVGKIIAKAAAENLTPVTLELGGKSPCIVHKSANLEVAAKRIVWGKIINAGQTCVAPDYVLVDQRVKNKFVGFLIKEITSALGENPEESLDYARIINLKNWERQIRLLENQEILFGGESNRDTFYLAPTIVNEPSLNSDIMQEEIFGPILPIISFNNYNEMTKIIKKFEKPLSFYIFSEDDLFIKETLTNFSFGGGCVNDTLVHLANSRLPFGGVGHSGMGAYHGRLSFDIFSHQKSVLKKPTWIDIPLRYAPYGNKLNKIKKILNWL